MLYELRRYDVAPTKLPALLDRFGSFTVHKWKEYGFRLIGFWTPVVGEKSNQLVYIWGWESYRGAREEERGLARRSRAREEVGGDREGRPARQPRAQPAHGADLVLADGPRRGLRTGRGSTRKPYLFELREYQAMPQKITNITDRFGNFTCDAFKKHGFRQVGYWRNIIGANDHQLIYLLAWESLDERIEKFDTFAEGPRARPRVRREREERPHRAAGDQRPCCVRPPSHR